MRISIRRPYTCMMRGRKAGRKAQAPERREGEKNSGEGGGWGGGGTRCEPGPRDLSLLPQSELPNGGRRSG